MEEHTLMVHHPAPMHFLHGSRADSLHLLLHILHRGPGVVLEELIR